MEISAVICTYNRDKYIGKVLESLANQTLDKDKYEIIVVNNNSTDNTEEVCLNFEKKHPELNFKYVVEYNQGLSYARNRGIDESKGDIIVFLDDDARVVPEYLEVIVDFMKKNPKAVAVGGKVMLDYDEEPPKWASKFLIPLFGYFDYSDKIARLEGKHYPRGLNMAFRKTLFDEIGVFDINLGRTGKKLLGNEEKDIFMRIYDKGYEVYYLPEALAYHAVPVERTTSDFIKKQALGIGISERFRTKNLGQNSDFTKAVFIELFKWAASFALLFFYTVTFKPAKGIMIVRFRYWVTKGLLTHNDL